MALIKYRRRSATAEAGFTLVEILVVISILGALAAVAMLSVTRFMNAAVPAAYEVERKQVHTAAGLYLLTGNHIASATTVGPGNLGIVAPWLTGNLKYFWTINTDGGVFPVLFASSLNTMDGFTPLSGSWTPGADGLTSNGDASSLVVAGGNWDDFTYQTSATFTSDDGFGMTYRSDGDASNGYVLQFDPVQNAFVVSKVVNGVQVSTLGTASMPAGFGGQHNISVSVSGNNHTVMVDGAAVMTFQDSTYGSGTVGLQTSAGSDVNFTGFTVSPP
jgi:prepilin-type N-terminal cleavage/methylation domain-containing protein